MVTSCGVNRVATMSDDSLITGGCACGSVRYEAIGKPGDAAYCHCSDCRRFAGAPAVAWAAFPTENVHFLGHARKTFESSPGIRWGFCGECGSSLSWEGESFRYPGKHTTEILICTLDNPEQHAPDRHWYESERLSWFDIADRLPRYAKLDYDDSPTHFGPAR